jgi:SAM-dependent methyltransferase
VPTIPFEPRRFRSTAEYYVRYRVPYPPALIASVAERVGLKPGDRVLDLGCGPGILALAFARLGMAVTAMDPEPEMLAAARAAAFEANLDIEFREGSSYDLGPALGRFRLVTMGRSFHWMDRPATLATLDSLIEPGGGVALFHDEKIAAMPDWQAPLSELSESFSPARSEGRKARRADDWQPHPAVLLDSPFSAVETRGLVFGQRLSADDIVGRAYSMSVTSPEALGDQRKAFEAELRARLAALAPDGVFREVVEAVAILAFRPSDAGGQPR